VNWIKKLFSDYRYFELEENKEYTLKELIEILKVETLSIGTGNRIVLKILDELVKKHEK